MRRSFAPSALTVIAFALTGTMASIEDGGVQATSDSDDLSTDRLECAIAGSKMKCTSKVMQRVCHIDKTVVPCDSF